MIPFLVIYWDPNPEIFRLPFLNIPILWYGLLFALGFFVGFPLFVRILTRFLGDRKKSIEIADRLTLYMIVSTVIGARLGHFLFYEDPKTYLNDPVEILRIWEGGLASHGAAIGIVVGLLLFRYKVREFAPNLTLLRLLDFVCVPTALASFFIRIGNFMNQEILGVPSNLPWAVVFGHPADRSPIIARHPVQLYEAFFYLAVFFILWNLSQRSTFLEKQGKLIGLFLILVFGFRFGIEELKLEQSDLLVGSFLTMGQILSIPAIIIGLVLYLWP